MLTLVLSNVQSWGRAVVEMLIKSVFVGTVKEDFQQVSLWKKQRWTALIHLIQQIQYDGIESIKSSYMSIDHIMEFRGLKGL